MKTVMVFNRDGEREPMFSGSDEACAAYIEGYIKAAIRFVGHAVMKGEGQNAHMTFLIPRISGKGHSTITIWAE